MKIKILQVVGNLRIGGAETVAVNIIRHIDRERFDVHYLVYGDKIGDYEDEVKKLGGTVIHVPCFSNPFRYGKMLGNINRKYGPYGIIHSHMMFHNGIVLSAAKKIGIPIRISHAHSTSDGSNASGFMLKMIRRLYIIYSRKRIVDSATIYISCGKIAGEKLYGSRFFEKYGKIIINGINAEKYSFDIAIRNKMREENNLTDYHVYGCIGHFDEVKNHQFLVELFDSFCREDEKARLLLLGEGRLRSEIESIVKNKHIDDKVIFTGNVVNIHEWIQAIDCLLMPSLYEGVPLTLIEAQASGLKCLVSANVSDESAITDCVTFIPLENPKIWVENMRNLNYKRRSRLNEIFQSGYDVIGCMNKIYFIYEEQIASQIK